MQQTSELMLQTARAFLAGLLPAQRAQACFDFDDEERFTWHFTPIPRRGIPLRDLMPHQQHLAQALISSGYSPVGAIKANQIMSLEQVLHEYETVRRFVRDPDLYFISVFGDPSPSQTWGWRLEGHHVSLSVTIVDGQTLATTPCFFGANRAEVREGPRAGLRVLAAEEDLARELLKSLDDRQRSQAVLSPEAPDDLLTYNHRRVDPLGNDGIASAELSPTQRRRLVELLEVYADPMPADVANARMAKVHGAAADQLRFAWAGGDNRGERHYYRIQSPEFMVEYDNTQDGANHIHSVWRDYNGDWGLDLLSRHLTESHGMAKAGAATSF